MKLLDSTEDDVDVGGRQRRLVRLEQVAKRLHQLRHTRQYGDGVFIYAFLCQLEFLGLS